MQTVNVAKYEEMARGKISEKRNVVISKRSKGGITVAQQLESQEGDRVTNVFLKGAFHVENVQGLYNMRDALNAAIKAIEEDPAEDGETWDSEGTD